MAIPLRFLRELPSPKAGVSLGDHLSSSILPRIDSFLDCFPTTSRPAILPPQPGRPPLCHNALRDFVADFRMPCGTDARRLGPNDRIMIALPTTPAAALALLALSCYHTAAPVNISCTPSELLDDARRLGVRAVVATADADKRLNLRHLAATLECDIIFLDSRHEGPTGLFDLRLMDDDDFTFARALTHAGPTPLCGLEHRALVLQTSGTSGKKKVVPYPLRNLIVGTCAVIQSWDLQEADVNSASLSIVFSLAS